MVRNTTAGVLVRWLYQLFGAINTGEYPFETREC